jgi:hypothetical protein
VPPLPLLPTLPPAPPPLLVPPVGMNPVPLVPPVPAPPLPVPPFPMGSEQEPAPEHCPTPAGLEPPWDGVTGGSWTPVGAPAAPPDGKEVELTQFPRRQTPLPSHSESSSQPSGPSSAARLPHDTHKAARKAAATRYPEARMTAKSRLI